MFEERGREQQDTRQPEPLPTTMSCRGDLSIIVALHPWFSSTIIVYSKAFCVRMAGETSCVVRSHSGRASRLELRQTKVTANLRSPDVMYRHDSGVDKPYDAKWTNQRRKTALTLFRVVLVYLFAVRYQAAYRFLAFAKRNMREERTSCFLEIYFCVWNSNPNG